ncbi:MAG: hypothetical protein AB1Z23_07400 [Eubacteriales bacterium]
MDNSATMAKEDSKKFDNNELAVIYKALSVYQNSGAVDYSNKLLCDSLEKLNDKFGGLLNTEIEKYTRINVMIVEPNRKPYVKTVSDDFETLEDEIGQNSMILYNLNATDTVVVCSEDDYKKCIEKHSEVSADKLEGKYIITNSKDEWIFTSLTDGQINSIKHEYSSKPYEDKIKQNMDKVIKDYKSQPSKGEESVR